MIDKYTSHKPFTLRLQTLIAISITTVTGCASLSLNHSEYGYDLASDSKLKNFPGTLVVTGLEQFNLNFQFSNTSAGPARIIWDESALVDTNGNSHRVLYSGKRYIEASQPSFPTLVPPGGTLTDSVSYADGLRLIGTTWVPQEIVPCASYGAMCAREQYYGKTIVLFLTVESAGKKSDFTAKVLLKKKADRVPTATEK